MKPLSIEQTLSKNSSHMTVLNLTIVKSITVSTTAGTDIDLVYNHVCNITRALTGDTCRVCLPHFYNIYH